MTVEAVSPLRQRTSEISAEYWAVRDGGQPERVAVAQLFLALARSEAEVAALRGHLAGVVQRVMDHKAGDWPDCSPLLCGHPANS